MTKEDKQIIDRAVKEEWRIGDRSHLKRLLKKNLKLYRENVELERELEQTEKDLADYQFNYPKIKELEKENAELKCECRRCIYSDSPCVLSDYGKDRNGICNHFKDVFDTVAELRIQNTNANLKGLEVQVAKDSYRDRANKTQEQLIKATKIIKGLLSCCRNYPHENAEKMKQAEQFIKDLEKVK